MAPAASWPWEPGAASHHRRWKRVPESRAWWGQEQRRRQRELEALESELAQRAAMRERQLDSLSRHYILLSSEVILIGPTHQGVGVESFLDGIKRTSGRSSSAGVRLGLETEPWSNRLKTRIGTYVEPSRWGGTAHRLHVTAGFDVRLFRWDLFGLIEPFQTRIGMSADAASRYINLGFSAGFWH